MLPQPPESTLATWPATAGQRRFAAAVVAVSAILFVGLAPFAKIQLAPFPAFIPIYEAALVANDLVTAALILAQFVFFRSRALLILASGYLFTACLAIAHALTFPGLFTPTGLLGAGPQSTAWLYMFWHAGFPLFVIAYALVEGEVRTPWAAIAKALSATIGGAAAAVLLATAGEALLPAIMSGNRYTPQMIAVVTSMWVMSLVAFGFLWRRRPATILDLWLMVVMWAWVFDIALSAVLNQGRFDLGFYSGRVYGLLAASVVLVALITENARLYSRLRERTAESERAREAAHSAERAKDAYLATMSHEIRTPMNAVMGMLELLSLSRLDAEQRANLGVVRESGRSLLRIIDDILDFSKIESGKLELRPGPVQVGSLVSRVRDFHSANAAAKGLVLRHEVGADLAPMHVVDPVRLQQILNNLVGNAIKFTARGEVSIRAELLEKCSGSELVRFTVEDTGIGVAEADQRKLFEPFGQVGDAARGGTGLGLSISRDLARLMGGSLEMESRPGAGTKMRLALSIPVADPGSAGSAVAPQVAPATGRDRRVLLVDDDTANRLVIVKQLASLGFQVDVAGSGQEALDKWNGGGHCAIITDCGMPELDGYELARRVRAREANQGLERIPIIACSANVLRDGPDKAREAGIDDYISKPARLKELQQALERWTR